MMCYDNRTTSNAHCNSVNPDKGFGLAFSNKKEIKGEILIYNAVKMQKKPTKHSTQHSLIIQGAELSTGGGCWPLPCISTLYAHTMDKVSPLLKDSIVNGNIFRWPTCMS